MPPIIFTKEDHSSLKISAYIISIKIELATSQRFIRFTDIFHRSYLVKFEMTTRILYIQTSRSSFSSIFVHVRDHAFDIHRYQLADFCPWLHENPSETFPDVLFVVRETSEIKYIIECNSIRNKSRFDNEPDVSLSLE